MMRSLFSAISGLRVHQTKMDVIANNISNVNTVGFKSSRVTFNEVFTQTLSGAAAPNNAAGVQRGGTNPMQIGLGANVASIDMLMTTGAAQRTDNPFDVMIQGDGFFVVSTGNTQYYTRAGAFRVDESGNLTMPNGYIVNGWDMIPDPENENKFNAQKGSVIPIQISGDKEFSPPKVTDNIVFTGNLNAIEDGVDGINRTLGFFDSEGNKYTLDVRYVFDPTTKNWSTEFSNYMYPNGDHSKGIKINVAGTAPTAAGAQMDIAITVVDQVNANFDPDVESTYDQQAYTALPGAVFEYTANGMLSTAATTNTPLPITGFNIFVDPADPAGHTLGNLISPNVSFGTVDTTGANPNPIIAVDLTQTTQYYGESNLLAETRTGHMMGTLIGLSVGTDGIIVGRYDNGQTKQLAQIVLAQFANSAGLERVGSNLFTVTNNSGQANIGAVAAGGGSLLGGVLEMANVDLAGEFTEMITTQRGFQANSRVITTSDDMLQELVNLKR